MSSSLFFPFRIINSQLGMLNLSCYGLGTYTVVDRPPSLLDSSMGSSQQSLLFRYAGSQRVSSSGSFSYWNSFALHSVAFLGVFLNSCVRGSLSTDGLDPASGRGVRRVKESCCTLRCRIPPRFILVDALAELNFRAPGGGGGGGGGSDQSSILGSCHN